MVHFHVPASYGQFLCQWAREWELARQFECLSLNAPLKETAKDVEHLFEKQTGEWWPVFIQRKAWEISGTCV